MTLAHDIAIVREVVARVEAESTFQREKVRIAEALSRDRQGGAVAVTTDDPLITREQHQTPQGMVPAPSPAPHR